MMVQKFVWWDEIHKLDRVRAEFRLPKPVYDMVKEIAEKNDVSMTSLVTGLLVYAMDADRRQKLRVDVVSNVRVTEAGPADKPVHAPVPDARFAPRRRYGISNVR